MWGWSGAQPVNPTPVPVLLFSWIFYFYRRLYFTSLRLGSEIWRGTGVCSPRRLAMYRPAESPVALCPIQMVAVVGLYPHLTRD